MIENIHSLVSILPCGVVVVDKEGKVKSMNPYAKTNILSEKFFGKNVKELHDADARTKIDEFLTKLKRNENLELPVVKLFDFKGKSSLYLVKFAKIYNEKGVFEGIVAIFYDISSVSLSTVYDKDNKEHVVMDKVPVIDNDKNVLFLDVENIVFIRSIGSACLVFDINGKRYFSNLKISELEEKLRNKNFFRTHKSYLSNLAYLHKLIEDKSSSKIILKANREFNIPLSRRQKTKLRNIMAF